ncbi:hypothetical protein [Streptomyces sp. ALI-76-A]|uniref:hypothetical protein n=1 Tax=Streptomyces sp. ALI-76-A TaxID=3025736 RepID=UPI00256ECDAE|nr:hypothetical protein [Streptomyces sp. ALI-76-A]MDL5199534.1 hypothetical protein [Streptomyces sp. ALI-76-A]
MRELQDANDGHSIAIRKRMTDGEMPAVRVGGKLKTRESDLQPPVMPVTASRRDEQVGEQAIDDLNALAAKLVASWPELPKERRVELGRLLAAPDTTPDATKTPR